MTVKYPNELYEVAWRRKTASRCAELQESEHCLRPPHVPQDVIYVKNPFTMISA